MRRAPPPFASNSPRISQTYRTKSTKLPRVLFPFTHFIDLHSYGSFREIDPPVAFPPF